MCSILLNFDDDLSLLSIKCSAILKSDDEIEAKKLEKRIKNSIAELVNKRERAKNIGEKTLEVIILDNL